MQRKKKRGGDRKGGLYTPSMKTITKALALTEDICVVGRRGVRNYVKIGITVMNLTVTTESRNIRNLENESNEGRATSEID